MVTTVGNVALSGKTSKGYDTGIRHAFKLPLVSSAP